MACARLPPRDTARHAMGKVTAQPIGLVSRAVADEQKAAEKGARSLISPTPPPPHFAYIFVTEAVDASATRDRDVQATPAKPQSDGGRHEKESDERAHEARY